MTLDDMAQRLATMHDSNVVVVLERWTLKEQLYLVSNLRAPLSLRDATISKNNPTAKEFMVRKPSGSEIRCYVLTVERFAGDILAFHPNTPVFTISRTGIYETKAQ